MDVKKKEKYEPIYLCRSNQGNRPVLPKLCATWLGSETSKSLRGMPACESDASQRILSMKRIRSRRTTMSRGKQRKERPQVRSGKDKKARDVEDKENDPKGVWPRQFQDRATFGEKVQDPLERTRRRPCPLRPRTRGQKFSADIQRLRALVDLYIPNHSFPNHRAPDHRNVEQPQKTTARSQLDKGVDKENRADKVDKADKADKKAPKPKPITLDEILQKTKPYNQDFYRK